MKVVIVYIEVDCKPYELNSTAHKDTESATTDVQAWIPEEQARDLFPAKKHYNYIDSYYFLVYLLLFLILFSHCRCMPCR